MKYLLLVVVTALVLVVGALFSVLVSQAQDRPPEQLTATCVQVVQQGENGCYICVTYKEGKSEQKGTEAR